MTGSIRFLALAALAGNLAACGCTEPEEIYSEGFENCPGLCQWQPRGDGVAEVTSTIHPGEHGLYFDGSVTVERAFAPGEIVLSNPDQIANLHFVTDCLDYISVTATVDSGQGTESIDIALYRAEEFRDNPALPYQPISGAILWNTFAEPHELRGLEIRGAPEGCIIDQIRITRGMGLCEV